MPPIWCLAPEHPLVDAVTAPDRREAVEAYRQAAARKSDLQRQELEKEKTGVFTGGYAVNPVNDERLPIWIADYVLLGYGTGAIMAVPAHDARDWAFAKTYSLPIREVIAGGDVEKEAFVETEQGTVINSTTPRRAFFHRRPGAGRCDSEDHGLARNHPQGPEVRQLQTPRLAVRPTALLG